MLLLEFNPDAQALLDWVIDRCYTGSHEVADGCFNALASVFNNRYFIHLPFFLKMIRTDTFYSGNIGAT